MNTNRALGKGLASLISPSESQPKPETSSFQDSYFECSIEDIIPSRNQPRKLFPKEALEELAASIREHGIIQPLIVRKIEGGKYELIAGERRFRASQIAGRSHVPVVVSQAQSEEVLELALIENIQRQDLNPIEEALAYRELQDKYQLTQDDVAKRVGKDRSSIANSLRLLGLPEAIRAHIIDGKLSMGHARALLSLEEDSKKTETAQKIIQDQLSVREAEALIRRLKTGPQVIYRAQTTVVDPQIRFLEEEMTRNLGTKVKIQPQGKRGKILIEYYNSEELERIFNQLKN